MNQYRVSMSQALARNFNAKIVRSLLAGLAGLTLAGCVSPSSDSPPNGGISEKLPQHQLADYLLTDCDDIQLMTGTATESNPLFWMRAMDCAGRLPPAEARAQARLQLDDTWQDGFMHAILLGSAKITPLERREMMARLDTFSSGIPGQVRPLYQIWRDGQMLELQLSSERSRYAKLQQSTDGELDTLRQQQEHLRNQLDLTTRKLENLTDIERRLSSRKPTAAFNPDSDRSTDKPAPEDEQQGEENP
ncbi:MAG TPA: two-component system QseEF-associated lipoprotein QseG [Enterobacteriaceae bacterium]|nr:two-component system QseEF-associated lipoprotein QseG [Enterobacteriaceae bacterium]